MLKKFILVFFVLISAQLAGAATITFFGACSDRPFLQAQITAGRPLGTVTIELLKNRQINFSGDETGITSLFGLNSSIIEMNTDDPTLAANQLRVYGWCYKVNNQLLSLTADQYIITSDDHIEWYYGYAFYDNGNWTSMCQEAYKLVPEFICGDMPLR